MHTDESFSWLALKSNICLLPVRVCVCVVKLNQWEHSQPGDDDDEDSTDAKNAQIGCK